MGAKDEKTEDIELHRNEPRKHNDNFKGPIENRSCTDVICCLVFLVFILGLVAVSVLGFVWGNPSRLLYPTDSSGLICGYDEAVKDRPVLVYFDILKCARMGPSVVALGCPTPQVCRKSCTNEYFVYLETVYKAKEQGTLFPADIDKMICKDGVNISASTEWEKIDKLVTDNQCAAYYVETTDIVGRCIPSIFKDILETAVDQLTYSTIVNNTPTTFNLTNTDSDEISGTLLSTGSEFLALFYSASQAAEMVFKDIIAARYLLVLFFVIAMVSCFIWIVIMRWITGFMVWFSIFAVLGIMGFGSYFSYSEYYSLKKQNSTAEFGVAQAFALNFSYYLTIKELTTHLPNQLALKMDGARASGLYRTVKGNTSTLGAKL